MEREKAFCLQFFAEEEQGETAGVSAADAGQQEESREGQSCQRMSWEEIMADPEYRSEYDRQVQGIVKKRLRDRQGNEERLKRLDAAMDELCKSFGMERSQGQEADPAALVETIRRERAQRSGEAERRAAQARQQLERLHQQEEALRRRVPDFDLARELENPAFLRMTSPGVGLSVEDAYYAVHRKEIQTAAMQQTARQTAEQMANAIRSGQRRPTEHGTSAQAPSVTTFDYAHASKEQREALQAFDDAMNGRTAANTSSSGSKKKHPLKDLFEKDKDKD